MPLVFWPMPRRCWTILTAPPRQTRFCARAFTGPAPGSPISRPCAPNGHNDAPVVPIVFYRALVQGAGLHPINRLTRVLLRKGLNPMPVFVASLKDPVSVATLDHLFTQAPPQVILNCTSFAVGSPHDGDDSPANPLAAPSANAAPMFQVVLASTTEDAWEAGLTGLSARDIAMNVALPEVDGRILSRAISFKGEAYFDEATECPIATYRARGDRVDFVADLAANWARLRATPAPLTRKVALILANYPNKDGRLANGVGLDTPAATVHVLNLLAEAGYGVETPPADADALMAQIMAGPTNWLTDRADRARRRRPCRLPTYRAHYGQLALRAAPEDRGSLGPAREPIRSYLEIPRRRQTPQAASSCRSCTYGNVVVGLQPARGYNIDPTETYHSPDLVPPHNYLAFYFWLRHMHGADAIVHMGKHGNLEWLPGKALALSETCLPEAVLGPTAAYLSVHRQRPRRRHAGQAPRAGGDHRPPDPAADPRRNLRAAARSRSAGRRILRGRRRRPAPDRASAARDPVADRRPPAWTPMSA